MKRLIAVAALSLTAGCMNMWTRNPLTDTRIERCYQSSSTMAGAVIIVSFPQMMSDCPGDNGFMWENVFTVPLGCLVMCDAACEAVVDTVCLPFDWPISAKRRRDLEAWQEERRREYEASQCKGAEVFE